VNARLHPERNAKAIQDSLTQFGQVKPIVVRAETRIVMAGNGTLAAAKALGWDEIAAVFIEGMSDAEAAAYGLADNRTAELAKWDFEVVAKLDKIIEEAGINPIGWSDDELEVLRAADWTPPPVDESQFGSGETSEDEPLIVSFTPDEYTPIADAINAVREANGKSVAEMSQAEAISLICQEWNQTREESDSNGN
jgi:hypothetical protein